jgi:outer membrane protein TolC
VRSALLTGRHQTELMLRPAAAERQMETENALIEPNVAAFFPDISLSAALSNSGSARDRGASRRNIIAQAASIQSRPFFEKMKLK